MKVVADQLISAMQTEGLIIQKTEILPVSRAARTLTMGLSSLSRFSNYYERYMLYPRIIKGLGSDIFHILEHTFSYLLKYIDPSKTIVTCMDLILLKMMHSQFEGHKPPAFALHLFKRSISHIDKAARIITISKNTKKDLIELLGIQESKIVPIYCGIDERFRKSPADPSTKCRKDAPTFKILHVGGNLFYKNFEGVLHGIASVEPMLKKRIRLVKVGSPLSAHHKKIIKDNKLSDIVDVKERIGLESLVELYRESDIFLFPSLYEGFGMPPLEAMGQGTPVITSQRGSLFEVCADAAHYVDPLDAKDIGLAIERIISDDTLRNGLIEKGLKRAAAFTWEEAARKTYKVYKQVHKE